MTGHDSKTVKIELLRMWCNDPTFKALTDVRAEEVFSIAQRLIDIKGGDVVDVRRTIWTALDTAVVSIRRMKQTK